MYQHVATIVFIKLNIYMIGTARFVSTSNLKPYLDHSHKKQTAKPNARICYTNQARGEGGECTTYNIPIDVTAGHFHVC